MKRPLLRLLPALSLLATGFPALAETPPAPAAVPATSEQAAEKKEEPDYVRMAEDEKSIRLEICVTSFTLPDGRVVDLFGVVHLADASYYQEVDRRLAGYDSVLFELVGDPEALQKPDTVLKDQPARPNPLRGLQQGIGNVFKLTFQLEKIDYTRPNFVHADASAEEFAKMQADRGESMMKLLLKSFQLSGDPALQEKLKDANNIGLGDMVMLFYSDKSMQRIKAVFARLLADSEELLNGKMFGEDNAIIHGRNEVALKKLDEVLADPAKKRVAVFYGAGHMPSMETDLTTRLKAVRGKEEWLPAWTMPAQPKAQPKADAAPENKMADQP
jgi:hypothetical protein